MFPNGEDLPLFSGVAQRGFLRPFAPKSRVGQKAGQGALFELEMADAAEKHRVDFYWLCPECEAEVHISYDRCPVCEVDDVA